MPRGKRSPGFVSASGFLFPCVLILLIPFSSPQDKPKETHNQNVRKLCKQVENQYRNKKDRDVEAIVQVYQIFDEIYSKATPREQKAIVKAIRNGYAIQPFPEESSFMITGAACLSGMGKLGLDAMIHALKLKTLGSRPSEDGLAPMAQKRVKQTLIVAIGYNKNPSALKTLYNYLVAKEAVYTKSACEALSCYSFLPLEQRKPVVEKMVQAYARLDAEAAARGDESEAYEKLLSVEVAFNVALQRLTFRTFESAPEWKKWFAENKNKKKW